jgi:hypothetical protein
MKPTTNPILENLWQVKDDLIREAGHDLRRLCENTRRWAVAHPHSGPVVENVAALRALLAREVKSTKLALREDAPAFGSKSKKRAAKR